MKTKSFLLSLLLLFFFGCAEEENLSDYQLSVISYFKEIALGFEFGSASEITRRWETDMKVFVGGYPSNELLAELNTIVNDINALTTTDFTVDVVTDSLQANFYVYLGPADEFVRIFPDQANYVDSNWGLFTIYWNSSNQLYTGYMYVDVARANNLEQKHLLREELTQSLGLAKDSYQYPESIFQQSFETKVTAYAPIDKDLIRLLYHPDMRIGLDRSEVDKVLRSILTSE